MGFVKEHSSYGPAAMASLRAAVDAAQSGNRLAPVTVIVPSNSVGVAARRWLARNGGIAAAQFVTTFRLAEVLAGPGMAASGRRPVSNPVVDVVVRQAIAAAPGMFGPVAHHHATITALRTVHRELRHLATADVANLANSGSERAREVVRLHRDISRRLSGRWYDEADLLRAAAASVLAGIVPGPAAGRTEGRWSTNVVALLPERLRPTEADLFTALARVGDLHVIEGYDDMTAAPLVVDVLDLSDADEEAREVVRQIVAATRAGTPLERIAALWPVDQPYARLVTEQLDAAGITWNGRPGIATHERLAARLVLDVLSLDRRGIRRADLFGVLAHVPARQSDGRPVPTQRWERLARDGAAVGDADWEGRLATYQRNLPASRSLDADAIGQLRAFVMDLRDLLGDREQPRPWKHWADLCHRLLDRWLGTTRRLALLPDVEQRALGTVQAAIDRLGQIDLLDGPVLRSTFTDALAAELDAAPGRVGRIGTGVQVGPLAFASAQSLDLVLVMGACEGQLPSPPVTDPLLGDADRALAGGGLALADHWLAEQRRQLFVALAAAPHAVLTTPRGDLRSNALRQPSRWITELASDVLQLRASVPSFAAGLTDAPFPATVTQHRVRALAHHVRVGAPIDTHRLAATLQPLHDGLSLLRARALPVLTAYDGDLTGLDIPSPLAGRGAISPSRLELWVECPFAYFVHHVLGVSPVADPEAAVQITPLDRGALLHETLDRFHQLVIAGMLAPVGTNGWTPVHATALLGEFDAVTADYSSTGRLGRAAFWDIGQRQARRELLEWLTSDGDWLARRRANVVHSELEFGGAASPAAAIQLTSGRIAHLRGKVDRIDRGHDGTLYVTDHKTGASKPFRDISEHDPTAGGTKLQLPAYAAAALAAAVAPGHGIAPVVHAEYSFVGPEVGRRVGSTFTGDVWPTVGAALERIVDGIESGLFFAHPEKSQYRRGWVTCEYCDPDHLGTAERLAEFELKRVDPRVAAFVGAADDTDGTWEDGPDA